MLVVSVLPGTRATAAEGPDNAYGAQNVGSAARFEPTAPQRILDTRDGTGAPRGRVAPRRSVDVQVTGRAGIPADAVAVALNVTVTDSSPGFVQVLPTGRADIGAFSNLNVDRPGQTIANHVTVPVGDGGRVTVYTDAGAHLIADVFGYYVAATSTAAGRFVAFPPSRILDSRNRIGVPLPVNPGDTVNCGDFATWTQANEYFWRYYDLYGDVGRLDGNNDRIPCESLPGAPATPRPLPGPGTQPLGAGGRLDLQVTGRGGVPATGVSAAVVNVTMTQSAAAGFVQVVPTSGATPIAASSNVNADRRGQTVAGMSMVPLGSGGRVTVYSSSGTHVVVDVIGYVTGPSAATSDQGLFVPLTPSRLLDTRSGARPGGQPSIPVSPLNRGGLPATGVAALLYNVTLTQTTQPGFGQLYPTGQASPGSSSTLNVERAGQTIANAALGALGGGGTSTLYVNAATHAIVDVFGYVTGPGWTPPAVDPDLAQLVVAPQLTSPAYDRDQWQHWTDEDGDCQDTRAEVLVAESLDPVTSSATACTITGGRWVDPWSGMAWTVASDVDVDHHVPLANAHASGGAQWDTNRKRAYANDLVDDGHLTAMEDGLNSAKGSDGPDGWKPPLTSSWCRYAEDWVAVKVRWSLTVTQAERDMLAQMLATC